LKLTQPVEAITGIEKAMEVTLDARSDAVTVRHRLVNRNLWPVELAPWALTVMQGPGRVILPQEPPSTGLLPVRPVGLWGYTNMADARWKWGAKFIQLACDPAASRPQKIGLGATPGWAAYHRDGQLFLKRFPFDPAATYPDYGCNLECYTRGDMLEVESLGPLTKLAPNAAIEHVESWQLRKMQVGETEDSIEAALRPILQENS